MAKEPSDGAAGTHSPDVRVEMPAHQVHRQEDNVAQTLLLKAECAMQSLALSGLF